MATVNTKRIYDKPSPNDGYRVFIDKIWPKGVAKSKVKYDLWAKNIAPSISLRKWFHEDPDSNWNEFEEKYNHELEISTAIRQFLDRIKGEEKITLLYTAQEMP